MLKKIFSLFLSLSMILSFVGCTNKDDAFKNDFTIPSGNEDAYLITSKMMLSSIDFADLNPDILDSYSTISDMYAMQNVPSYFNNHNYKYILSDTSSLAINWGNSLVMDLRMARNLSLFKGITNNKSSLSKEELLCLFFAENFYRNIDFDEYRLMLKNSANQSYVIDNLDIQNATNNKKELDDIESNSLFNIQIQSWDKNSLKLLSDYESMYKDIFQLNIKNLEIKNQMDALKKDILDPISSNYCNIDYFLDETYNILSNYSKLIEKDSQGFKSIFTSLISRYIPDYINNGKGAVDIVSDIIKGDFDVTTLVKDGIYDAMPLPLSTLIRVSNGLVGLLNDNVTNKRLATQFALSYMFSEEENFTTPIDIQDLIYLENKVEPNTPKDKFLNDLANHFTTSLDGNMANASDEVISEILNLSNILNNYTNIKNN